MLYADQIFAGVEKYLKVRKTTSSLMSLYEAVETEHRQSNAEIKAYEEILNTKRKTNGTSRGRPRKTLRISDSSEPNPPVKARPKKERPLPVINRYPKRFLPKQQQPLTLEEASDEICEDDASHCEEKACEPCSAPPCAVVVAEKGDRPESIVEDPVAVEQEKTATELPVSLIPKRSAEHRKPSLASLLLKRAQNPEAVPMETLIFFYPNYF
jgi:hypothetical protein